MKDIQRQISFVEYFSQEPAADFFLAVYWDDSGFTIGVFEEGVTAALSDFSVAVLL